MLSHSCLEHRVQLWAIVCTEAVRRRARVIECEIEERACQKALLVAEVVCRGVLHQCVRAGDEGSRLRSIGSLILQGSRQSRIQLLRNWYPAIRAQHDACCTC